MRLEQTLAVIVALLFALGRAHGQAAMFLDPAVGPQPATGFKISVPPATITASFTFSPSGGSWPLTVQFVDTTQGGPASWAWNFGDGATSTSQNPIHVYNSASNFTASLTATGPGGSSSVSHSLTVTNAVAALLWVKTVLSTLVGATAQCNGVCVDQSGNVNIVGNFNDPVNFSGTPIANGVTFTGFVAQYTTNGTLTWVKTFGNVTANTASIAVAVDSHTNIIVAGSFGGTVDFGGVTLTAPDPLNRGATDMFVAKYNPAGTLLWATNFGGTSPDQATAVGVDSSDNILVSGTIQSGTATFGAFTITNNGITSMAVCKTSSTGVAQWAKSWGTSTVQPFGLAVDPSGNVVITGDFSGTTDIGGGPMTAAGSFAIFLAKYSGSNGSYNWSKGIGGIGFNIGSGVAVDPTTANVVMTGGFSGTANFGGGSVSTGGGQAAFLAGYDGLGNYLWQTTYGGAFAGELSQGNAIAIDAQGHLAWTGLMGAQWFVNGNSIPSGPYFVASHSISGNTTPTLRWFKTAVHNAFGGGSSGRAVSIDTINHVLTAGWIYSGTVDFGGITAVSPSGSYSGFTAQYQQ